MAQHPPTKKQRQAMCAWLEANGINPDDVPEDSDLAITAGTDGDCPDGGWVVRYEVYVRDPDTGHFQARHDEQGRPYPVREPRTTPLRVKLPETLTWLETGDEETP